MLYKSNYLDSLIAACAAIRKRGKLKCAHNRHLLYDDAKVAMTIFLWYDKYTKIYWCGGLYETNYKIPTEKIDLTDFKTLKIKCVVHCNNNYGEAYINWGIDSASNSLVTIDGTTPTIRTEKYVAADVNGISIFVMGERNFTKMTGDMLLAYKGDNYKVMFYTTAGSPSSAIVYPVPQD